MESAASNLQALVQEFYDVWLRFHQESVLRAGIPGYAGKMPAVDDDGVGALGSWLESAVVALEEIDFHALDVAGKIDMEQLFGACRDEYQAILEQDWRHRDPLGFMPFHTICRLVQDPGTDGWAALESFLKGTPEFLRQARAKLAEYPALIPSVWVSVALKEGEAGIVFLKRLGGMSDASPEMQALCDQVVQAVGDYLRFLEQDVAPKAEGTAACGWQRFQEQLRLRHHLPDKLGDHLEMARQIYQETLTELNTLSFEQSGSSDPQRWLQKLAGEHPLQGDARLQFVRQRSNEIHRQLSASGQFRLPDAAGLELRPAPEGYPIDCAPAYWPPAPATNGSPAILYLAPVPPGSLADTPERLTAWCIRNAWPGRHLLAASAALSPVAATLVRRLNHMPGQQISWALYTEQLLTEGGLFTEPEQRLQSLLERLRRSLLAVLDIEMHVYGMEASAVLLQLQSLPGNCVQGANRDLLSLTRHPTQHLAAVVGWKLLDALKQWHLTETKAGLADFHVQLLAQGNAALPLIIRRVFGQQAWDWVEARVYSQ